MSRALSTTSSTAPPPPLFTSEDLLEAVEVVGAMVPPTPTHRYPLLTGEVGTEVWVKHENATPTGAFKVRGGLTYLERMRLERPTVTGVATATRGNHGASLALAGRVHGAEVVIVVPEGNGEEKNAAMEGYGAELIVHGADFEAARAHAEVVATERGLEPVPPFHPDLVVGVATYARELFGAVAAEGAPLDAVFVPVGMGSGIAGLITVRDLLDLPTRIIGVCAEAAPAQALSFAAGEVVTTERAATFVDGVATRRPDPTATALIARGAHQVVTVTEDEAAGAIRRLWRTTHHLAEPAGALALAGLWNQRESWVGRRVAVVVTGAAMDTAMAAEVLAGGTPAPGPAPTTER
jgi:threonine dehydratase